MPPAHMTTVGMQVQPRTFRNKHFSVCMLYKDMYKVAQNDPQLQICLLHIIYILACRQLLHNTYTYNRFTAPLEYVRDHPGEQVPER